MNKEVIERTKARCKKKKYDHVWSGEYQSGGVKPLRISRSNGCKTINPKEAGVIVPREIYAAFGYMAAMSIASIVTLFVTGLWWLLS